MASGGKEHRMVFDIRGRRKVAVKVVYAVLAVLMGMSLFLVVGPLNVGELFNSSGGSSDTAKPFEEEAEKIELKLKREPENPDLLLALTRARVNAGNNHVVITNPQTGERGSTAQSRQQYQQAADAWSRYLEATKEPTAGIAQVVAPAFVALTLSSRTVPEAERNVHAAVQAQEIVAEKRPSIGTLSTLAIYKNFAFDYKGAQQAEKETLKLMPEKAERESFEKQMEGTRKQARAQQKYYKEFRQKEKSGAAGGNLQGGENPFSGAAGSGLE